MNFNVKEIDVDIDYSNLRNYYNEVCIKFQHLKFTNIKDVVDSEKHNVTSVYGWGIQSNLEDLTVPCPPWNVHKNRTDN